MIDQIKNVWSHSKDLCRKFTNLIEDSNSIFKEELLRTSLDISNDIAEWMKCSNHTNTIKLYKLANNKIYRLKNMLYLCSEYGYIDYKKFSELNEECDEMSSLIQKNLNIH